MRFAIGLLMLLGSFSTFASTIDRISPSTFQAGTAERTISIYGSDLIGPVIFVAAAGAFVVEVENGGSFMHLTIPTGAHLEAGQVEVRVGDARAFLTITAPPPPELQLQGGDPVVVPAEGPWGARVEYEVWAIGGRDPNPTVTCNPPSGSIFPLGPNHVRCVATNRFGERAEGGKYIFVADYGPPVVRVPEDIRVEAAGLEGTRVTFTVTASDSIDGNLPVTCDPPSGSLFPIGTTDVLCVAYDSSLNPGYGEFTVEVVGDPGEEEDELILDLPASIVAEATGPGGANVTFTVTAHGTSDPNPTVVCAPASGSLFALGTTTVSCTASDAKGNTASGSFSVIVQDTVAPMFVTIAATPDLLPPNHKWVEIGITAEALDVVDPMPRCAVIDITTNQPGGGSRITGDLAVQVLAERDPKLGDRTYSIAIECKDASGNAAEGYATVRVPKGKPDDEPASEPATVPAKKWRAIRTR